MTPTDDGPRKLLCMHLQLLSLMVAQDEHEWTRGGANVDSKFLEDKFPFHLVRTYSLLYVNTKLGLLAWQERSTSGR